MSSFLGYNTKHWLRNVKNAAQQKNLDSLLSYQDNYSAARDAPESRLATRALGDKSDLGVPSLTLGTSAPSPTVRSLDELLDGKMSSLLTLIGRGGK